jgi:hypothetical protein
MRIKRSGQYLLRKREEVTGCRKLHDKLETRSSAEIFRNVHFDFSNECSNGIKILISQRVLQI